MRLAIVKLSALGDIVHAMVVLQYIKSYYPEMTIDWFVDSRFQEILHNHPHIDNVYPLQLKNNTLRGLWKEYKRLKTIATHTPYDTVIDLQGLIKSAVVSKSLGRNVIGFCSKSLREPLAASFYNRSFTIPYEENVIVRNMTLTAQALHFTPPNLQAKQAFLFSETPCDFTPELLIFTGSSWPSKIYPKEHYVTLINALHVKTFVTWGNEAEHAAAQYICEHTDAELLPRLSLSELITLIKQSRLIIGSDSGPTHMAWALNRPSITIFGPTPSLRNTMTTSINKTIDSGKEIDPKRLNKQDSCIASINPQHIITLAKELLTC